jgi:plastocyanin
MWWLLAAIVSALIAAGPAFADDAPVVRIQDRRLHPPVLEVHVGEVVRWLPAPEETIRIELDPHPTAHEVAERAGDVRAIFLKSGEHSYVVTLLRTSEQLHGTVTVRPPRGAWERSLDCADGGSTRICVMP